MTAERPRYVLGLCYSHDASACLLRDGVPAVAIQKERLSRKRHDGSIMDIDLRECIEYCLKAEGLALEDLDLVVENSPTILYCKDKDQCLNLDRERLLDRFDQRKILQISHHLAHAYSAFALSPFDRSAVLIVDGQGNYLEDVTEDLTSAVLAPRAPESSFIERESFYEFEHNRCRVLRKNLSTIHKSFTRVCGVGHLYETVSAYAFRTRFDAGKLMGLAPFGEGVPVRMADDSQCPDIRYFTDWVCEHRNPNRAKGDLERHWDEYRRLAYSAQHWLERSVSGLAAWLRSRVETPNLCYAGGVALNCVANRRILDRAGFQNVFIVPAASDCGVSLGCALYGHLNVLALRRARFEYSDYLGRSYTENEIELALRAAAEAAPIVVQKSADIAPAAAKALAAGQIVGWFQGGSEFGPRALGNRSILCDPRNPEMKAILNARVKFREAFRPFAPSVTEEASARFFDVAYSPYMLLSANVRPEVKPLIPAVTHVDGTARIQTVNSAQNPRYHRLLSAFGALTGVPVLLNTSFNNNEPIVETPGDALNCFLHTGIDALCIGDVLVTKRAE